MPRSIIPLIIFAAAGLILSIAGMIFVLARDGDDAPRPPAQTGQLIQEPAALGLNVPEFQLVDQDGNAQTHELFEGNITILDFMFTHCPFACPGMTMAMTDLGERLKDTPVRFASISVDPLRDTPRQLKAYADRNGIDTSRWTLLTGDQAVVESIAVESLQFLLKPDDEVKITLPDGSQMSNVIHPTKFILVGPDRRVLGFYESSYPEDLDELARKARAAAKGIGR